MRIAYLTPRVPYPPISGGRLRAHYMLQHLARSHAVTVYAIGSHWQRSADFAIAPPSGLEQKLFPKSLLGYGYCAFKGLFSRLPFQVKLYESAALARALAEDVKRGQIDLLFVHLLRMADYVLPYAGVPRILDMVDSLCLHYHRMPRIWHSPRWLATRVDRARVCKYEAEMPGRFDSVLLASPADLAWVRHRTQAENLVLVPNGVDLEHCSLNDVPPEPNRIIFFGKLDYLPNADAAIYFAREIFPLVKRSVPEAHLFVVGWSPPRGVRALARLQGVTVRANVPDIRVEVAKSSVAVAPLRFGAGTQYKILESLALGVPVVATPEPVRALLEDTAGPILIGSNPEEFADQTARLLQDAGLRERARRAGRLLVESRYSWDDALAPLDRILDQRAKPTKQCPENPLC